MQISDPTAGLQPIFEGRGGSSNPCFNKPHPRRDSEAQLSHCLTSKDRPGADQPRKSRSPLLLQFSRSLAPILLNWRYRLLEGKLARTELRVGRGRKQSSLKGWGWRRKGPSYPGTLVAFTHHSELGSLP